jgi:hypothetical protein
MELYLVFVLISIKNGDLLQQLIYTGKMVLSSYHKVLLMKLAKLKMNKKYLLIKIKFAKAM